MYMFQFQGGIINTDALCETEDTMIQFINK